MRRLVSSKVDVGAVDASGQTALQVAIDRKDPGMVAVLQNGQVRQGANDTGGRGSLLAAASSAEASDLFSTTCLTTLDECQAFSHALASNVVMDKVVLAGSTLGVPGAMALSRALRANVTITTLVLASAIASAEEMRYVRKKIAGNRKSGKAFLPRSCSRTLEGCFTPHPLLPSSVLSGTVACFAHFLLTLRLCSADDVIAFEGTWLRG